MKTSVGVDIFLQWISLAVNVSIVVQSGIREVSFTNVTHLSSMRIFFQACSLSLFFVFCFFKSWEVFHNQNNWKQTKHNRSAAVQTDSEDILACDKNALSMNNRLAINRAKFSSKCVCSVHTVCVCFSTCKLDTISMWVCIINYTSSTLEAIIEIIRLFRASSPRYTIIFSYKNSITI